MTTFNCMVTHESYLHIGGGDPFMTEQRSYPAHFSGGAIFAPRLGEFSGNPAIGWDCVFRISGSAELPFKRYLTNHGTYAARSGGSPVSVRPLTAAELAAAQRKIAGWLA